MAKLDKKEQEKETKTKPSFKTTGDILGNFIGRIIQTLLYSISLPHLLAFPVCVHNVHFVPFFSNDYRTVLLWSR